MIGKQDLDDNMCRKQVNRRLKIKSENYVKKNEAFGVHSSKLWQPVNL
jgi:hypothetical protein